MVLSKLPQPNSRRISSHSDLMSAPRHRTQVSDRYISSLNTQQVVDGRAAITNLLGNGPQNPSLAPQTLAKCAQFDLRTRIWVHH